MTNPKLSRRRFMAIAGAGTALTGGAAWAAQRASAAGGGGSPGGGTSPASGQLLADTVMAAFERHRLVAIGEVAGHQEHHDALQILLADPRLPEAADDIVVEFGNSLYQTTVDRFTSGPAVQNPDLRLIWRNTTQSPLNTWDMPVYEQFYRMVRAANWTLPQEKQIRALLGDPPIDWPKMTTKRQVQAIGARRDSHMASVVEREVLDKGRRALICYGANHILHGYNAVARIERTTGQRVYVIVAAGHPRLSSYPRRTVIACKGTWLESADVGQFAYFPPHCGIPLGSLADAVLYLGPLTDQTHSVWNPAIYLDPIYWTELQRRNAINGGINLEEYRQEQPVNWQTPTGPGCPPN